MLRPALHLLLIAIPLLAGLTATCSAATNSGWDFAPYLNGRPWPRIAVTAYVERDKNIWRHPSDPQNFPTIEERHEDPDADFATVVLSFPDSRIFKTYNELLLGPELSEVYAGDFNSDGKPDFLAIKPSGMNGIGGWYSIGVFAFSEGDNYRFARIRSWGLGPESLTAAPASGGFRLIHTAFRQGKGTDGKEHSFWVHRMFRWEAGNFVLDTQFEPVWIQYLERPNHQATQLLTPQLKAKIWMEDRRFQSDIQW